MLTTAFPCGRCSPMRRCPQESCTCRIFYGPAWVGRSPLEWRDGVCWICLCSGGRRHQHNEVSVDKKNVNIGASLNIWSTCQSAKKRVRGSSAFVKCSINIWASSNRMNTSGIISSLSSADLSFEDPWLLILIWRSLNEARSSLSLGSLLCRISHWFKKSSRKTTERYGIPPLPSWPQYGKT